jgi:acetylornithine deacetylase/succinyl-diaminopimelate desuccinylase family protein
MSGTRLSKRTAPVGRLTRAPTWIKRMLSYNANRLQLTRFMATKPITALEIAQALVRIPSVNPNYDATSVGERDVAAWIQAWGEEQGFETRVQPVLDGRSNVILRLSNGADHPHLMFNGHTDTVAVTGMTIPPFGGHVSEQRLWGRGSADMKGPLACMLAAANQLRQDPQTWRGTLTVACVVDEEYHFRGTLALLDQDDDWDFAIVGEPTLLQIVRGCKGCMRFTLRAQGRTFHSSQPEFGRNAIAAMARAILELNSVFEEFVKVQHKDFGTTTFSVGLIEGGSGVNIVPEHCKIHVDVRIIPGQDPVQLLQKIETSLRRRVADVKDIEWHFELLGVVDPGYEISPDSPLVQTACEVVGQNSSRVVFFSCDASKIAARNVPCIILGPGTITEGHTANESIALAELEAGTSTYLRLAQKLMPAA